MPTYEMVCDSCSKKTETVLTYAEYDMVEEGLKPLCSCGGSKSIVFSPGHISFTLRDGESGGWASKADKERAYRAKRNAYLGKRNKENVAPTPLVPNYQGVEAASWSEARDMAFESTLSETKDASLAKEVASSYDNRVKAVL